MNEDTAEDLGCLGMMLLVIVGIAIVGGLLGFVSWVGSAPERECIAQRGNWSLTGECSFPENECKPAAAACEKALAERCQAEADGGVWEAIPYCHCLSCESTPEIDDAAEEWKKEAPKL